MRWGRARVDQIRYLCRMERLWNLLVRVQGPLSPITKPVSRSSVPVSDHWTPGSRASPPHRAASQDSQGQNAGVFWFYSSLTMRMFKDSIHGYSAPVSPALTPLLMVLTFPVPFHPKICRFIDTQVAAAPCISLIRLSPSL